MGNVDALVSKITVAILNPILALLFAAGLLVFMWGIVQFLIGLSGDSESKDDGKRHMLWGVIGMFVMVAAVAIVNLVASSIGAPYRA